MNKQFLFVGLAVLLAGPVYAAPTAAQQQAMSAKAKAFTGKTCASFTSYQEIPMAMSAATLKSSVKMMLDFQKSHGVKSLKQQQTATEFQQQAQQGSKQQFIYNGVMGGKTITSSCVLN